VKRSPFHARRLQDIDPAGTTVADLGAVPIMTKAQAQDCWDDIVTDRNLSRQRTEHVSGRTGMVFVHAGRLSGVQFGRLQRGSGRVRLGLAVLCVRRMSGMANAGASGAERGITGPDAALPCSKRGVPPHASTPLFDVPTAAGMETVVIAAGAPFDEVLAAVAAARPTHLVGYPSVIGRLARAVAGR